MDERVGGWMDRWIDGQLNKEKWIVLENKESKHSSKFSRGAGQVWETTKCELTMKNILDPMS